MLSLTPCLIEGTIVQVEIIHYMVWPYLKGQQAKANLLSLDIPYQWHGLYKLSDLNLKLNLFKKKKKKTLKLNHS